MGRGGPRGTQGFQRRSQRLAALAPFSEQRQQQAGGEPNQRRTAYPQGVNMPDQRLDAVGRKPVFLLRQRLLIEDPKLIVTNL